MPEIYNDWIDMNPNSVECPDCYSTDVSVAEETDVSTVYLCNRCRHRWEEYD